MNPDEVCLSGQNVRKRNQLEPTVTEP